MTHWLVLGFFLLATIAMVTALVAAATNHPPTRHSGRDPLVVPITSQPGDTVRGIWEDGIPGGLVGFHGVPFAEPPIGDLRWKPAIAKKPWGGEFNASTEGAICMQTPVPAGLTASEDCLTLNLFTSNIARTAGKLVPVLFWVYGGDNTNGWSASYDNLEEWVKLSDRGNGLIVVAPNYRVNVFGFMALELLSQRDPRNVSGNYAITDLITALEWVQSNIEAFGGDPTKVTVVGQSSGGTNLFAMLSAGPGPAAAKGLFAAGISLSGSPNITMSLSDAERQNLDFLHSTGCTTSECLIDLPASEVLKSLPASWAFMPNRYPADPSGWHWVGIVIVDGVTVTQPFFDAVSWQANNGSGPAVDVPLIIQSMANEVDFFRAVDVDNYTASQYKQYMYDSMTNGWNSTTVSHIISMYESLIDAGDSYRSDTLILTDVGLTCANQVLAQTIGPAFQSNVYISYVDVAPSHPYPAPPPFYIMKYAFHAWDYLAASRAWTQFGAWTPQPPDIAFGDGMRTALTEFITTSGTITTGGWLKTYNENGWFITNLIRNGESGTATPVPQFMYNQCQTYAALGFGPANWWSN